MVNFSFSEAHFLMYQHILIDNDRNILKYIDVLDPFTSTTNRDAVLYSSDNSAENTLVAKWLIYVINTIAVIAKYFLLK